jgi:hypothetical protein
MLRVKSSEENGIVRALTSRTWSTTIHTELTVIQKSIGAIALGLLIFFLASQEQQQKAKHCELC